MGFNGTFKPGNNGTCHHTAHKTKEKPRKTVPYSSRGRSFYCAERPVIFLPNTHKTVQVFYMFPSQNFKQSLWRDNTQKFFLRINYRNGSNIVFHCQYCHLRSEEHT